MNPAPFPDKPDYEVDFPIERVEAEHVSRREFAKFLCLVSGGMAVGSGWVAVKDKIFPRRQLEGELFVCNTSEVPLGGTRGFTAPGSKTPYILIHLNDGTWRAYEQKCTHLSCAVYYQPKADKIECPCHNGWFDARTGAVLQGPPPRPLPHLEVILKDENIYVREPHAA
ncbi:MAG: Rieske (2Fe-2S) protein [Methylacidiphilales bacterium]|nr:Rieske (2Fe-2S) protein [Candidatus Methylacidiphilales bacterium]